jgi:glycosyltransferase involved in cell wall biosynthesis
VKVNAGYGSKVSRSTDIRSWKAMRILIVSRYFYPHLGGGEIVLRQVFSALAKRGYKSYVITSRLENTPEYEEIDGLQIYRPFGGIFFAVRLLPYLKDFLKSHQVDIIFNWAYSCTLAASWAQRKKHLPVITHVDSLYGRTSFQIMNPFRALLFWMVPGIVIRFGSHSIVSCPSEEVAAKLKRYTQAEVITIPNPLDAGEIRYIRETDTTKDIRKELGTTDNEQLLLFVGRLSPEKNVRGLIKTLPNLSADYNLLVVGDGPERTKLENLTRRLNLERKVILLSQKSHRETLAIMKSCDVLILPSKTEVFPMVVLEALALGRPVIATKVGGIAEVKSPNLHLIDSLGEIDKVLLQIRPEPDQDILEHYSLNETCSRFEAMFGKLV